MGSLRKTVFNKAHVGLKAKLVEFSGWEMPLNYPSGVIAEHLATRKDAGLFDISHMGRFILRGDGASKFLQHVLTNNAHALDVGESHYTIVPNETGGAVDDAYLYRFFNDEYLLVVNACNRQKVWDHFQSIMSGFEDVELEDHTELLVMLALQGPKSRDLLQGIIQYGSIPEPIRNALSIVTISSAQVMVGRTGYTGEPLCFELFANRDDGPMLWDQLTARGAHPVGLGARDTLRLEAALPLYGQELGLDHAGKEIPILACPAAKSAVSFSPLKGDYISRIALTRQHEALKRIMFRDYSLMDDLKRRIRPISLLGRGVARSGSRVLKNSQHIGYITSGTMVPFWTTEGEGLASRPSDKRELRALGLALIDSDIIDEERVTVEIRGKEVDAVVVPYHLRSDTPPYARPIVFGGRGSEQALPLSETSKKVRVLLSKTVSNTIWRQRECINLIPSENTISPMCRLLSVMDPSFRYAERRKIEAFYKADIFYYQGTDFISEVERLLERELQTFLGCAEVETRLISGQMANTVVFSAMVDYLNHSDRKREPRRIPQVMNNHLGKGGHLSAQAMGALRDYVARDSRTERPAVVNFPVLSSNRYRIDVPATLELIDDVRPELIIFGKSMMLHKEPIAEIRQFLDDQGIEAVVMYDMAHVLGLVGPHFQQPFEEGADVITGSTHKTFFGTQRGIIGGRLLEEEERYNLWEAVRRRTFPGSVSNHHLGTMLGLLMAAYEMNYFKDEYQRKVIANAKTFARALKDLGLNVAGDSTVDFTETHQVVIDVGYGRGPEIARRLEGNNIICNYQGSPDDEGFSAARALRFGVSEMTRFGMEEDGFRLLAELLRDAITDDSSVIDRVRELRKQYCELRFCFHGEEYNDLLQQLHKLL